MIYDHRTYTCRAGTLKLHFALYEQHGWPAQTRHLGLPLLYAAVETGNPNSYIHIWRYESVEDRARRRAAMQADPDWAAWMQLSLEKGYLIEQRNQILTPTAFYTDPAAG